MNIKAASTSVVENEHHNMAQGREFNDTQMHVLSFWLLYLVC
jgi:hypothetical protein